MSELVKVNDLTKTERDLLTQIDAQLEKFVKERYKSATLIAYAEDNHKRLMPIIAARNGVTERTLENWARVARAFPVETYRPHIPWSLQVEVTSVPAEHREAVLDNIEKRDWTVQAIRERKKDFKAGHADAFNADWTGPEFTGTTAPKPNKTIEGTATELHSHDVVRTDATQPDIDLEVAADVLATVMDKLEEFARGEGLEALQSLWDRVSVADQTDFLVWLVNERGIRLDRLTEETNPSDAVREDPSDVSTDAPQIVDVGDGTSAKTAVPDDTPGGGGELTPQPISKAVDGGRPSTPSPDDVPMDTAGGESHVIKDGQSGQQSEVNAQGRNEPVSAGASSASNNSEHYDENGQPIMPDYLRRVTEEPIS